MASLHHLCRYFFAFDLVNYARLTPVYIAKLFSLKDKDLETWSVFNKGNFSVNKIFILFSTIGVDHVIEQENSSQSTWKH